MTTTTADAAAFDVPKGAHEIFLGLAAAAIFVMMGGILGYGLFGKTITDGLDRACAEAAFNAGKKLEAAGNYDLALQRYRQAMEGHFNDPERRNMCGRSIGELLYRQRHYAEAVDAFRELPQSAFSQSGHYAAFVSSLWRNNQLAEAEALGAVWLAKARTENQREQIVWAANLLMRIAETNGRPDEAIGYGLEAVRHDPANDAQIRLARILHQRGRKDEALQHLDAFLEKNSSARLQDDARRLRTQIAG